MFGLDFKKVKKNARRGLTSLVVDAGVIALVIAIILLILASVKGAANETTTQTAIDQVSGYFGSFGPIVVLVMLAAGVLYVLMRAFKGGATGGEVPR